MSSCTPLLETLNKLLKVRLFHCVLPNTRSHRLGVGYVGLGSFGWNLVFWVMILPLSEAYYLGVKVEVLTDEAKMVVCSIRHMDTR